MNTLREALQDYLALRRGLGFKMRDASLLLPRFVAFMEERQALHITTRLALEWVQTVEDGTARRAGPTACLHTRLCSSP